MSPTLTLRHYLEAPMADDPLIVQQGAVLLLASLNHPLAQPLPYPAFNAHIERHVAHPLQIQGSQ